MTEQSPLAAENDRDYLAAKTEVSDLQMAPQLKRDDGAVFPPVGTPLYFVPIRFWEDCPVRTGSVAIHTNLDGSLLPSFTEDGFVYAFHDEYGHNVYMSAKDTFFSHRAATDERDRRKAMREDAERIELNALMERIFADRRATP